MQYFKYLKRRKFKKVIAITPLFSELYEIQEETPIIIWDLTPFNRKNIKNPQKIFLLAKNS